MISRQLDRTTGSHLARLAFQYQFLGQGTARTKGKIENTLSFKGIGLRAQPILMFAKKKNAAFLSECLEDRAQIQNFLNTLWTTLRTELPLMKEADKIDPSWYLQFILAVPLRR
jgi:hypothetical protein